MKLAWPVSPWFWRVPILWDGLALASFGCTFLPWVPVTPAEEFQRT